MQHSNLDEDVWKPVENAFPASAATPLKQDFVIDQPTILAKGSCKLINLLIMLIIEDIALLYLYLLPLLMFLSSVPCRHDSPLITVEFS